MAPNDSGGTIVKEKSSKVIAVILKTIVTSEGGWLRQLGFANFFSGRILLSVRASKDHNL
jgi:hypothetical protein